MSDIFTRNTPTHYIPRRLGLEQDKATGEIVVSADFDILNAAGQLIDGDHPSIVLTAGEQSTFLAWFLAKLAEYETATGLTRWTGGG